MTETAGQAAAGARSTVVRLAGLQTGYAGTPVLHDLSFEVGRGELLAVIGPNGSGKSTLIKALVGLLPAWRGRVEVLGGDPAAARSRLGYMPQAERVDWRFPITVREVVSMGLYRRRWGAGRWRALRGGDPRVDQAMAQTRVADLAGRQVGDLSGGQQRRVLLARTLVRRPEILLLDEPAAGLDTTSEHELLELLRAQAGAGATVIVATHDIVSVMEFFDRVLCLKGRLIADGPPREVLGEETLVETFGHDLVVFHRGEHGYAAEPHVAHGRHEHD